MYSRNYTKNFTHIILLILYNKNIIDKCLTGVNWLINVYNYQSVFQEFEYSILSSGYSFLVILLQYTQTNLLQKQNQKMLD